MQKVQIGTKVRRLGIQRVSVAEGTKCRAVLLDENPRMKNIAYDPERKVRVEVDQDLCISHRLTPIQNFYYLVAKVNTDLNGNVIGDNFTVEYLQLSQNLNNEFSDMVAEQGIPHSLTMSKVKQIGNDGRDFSYIKVIPGKDILSSNPSLSAKIEELRNNQEFIEGCWSMIDVNTSITKEMYLKMLEGDAEQTPQPNALSAPKSAPQLNSHKAPIESSNDFGSGAEFDVQDFV